METEEHGITVTLGGVGELMCKRGSGQGTTWHCAEENSGGSWSWPGALLAQARPAQTLPISFCYLALGSLKKLLALISPIIKLGQWDLSFLYRLGLWRELISVFKVLWVWLGLFIFPG